MAACSAPAIFCLSNLGFVSITAARDWVFQNYIFLHGVLRPTSSDVKLDVTVDALN